MWEVPPDSVKSPRACVEPSLSCFHLATCCWISAVLLTKRMSKCSEPRSSTQTRGLSRSFWLVGLKWLPVVFVVYVTELQACRGPFCGDT